MPGDTEKLTELRADHVTRDTIDVNDGIERVMGNRDLYARMLKRFRNDYQDGALPIRTALAEDNLVLAHRMVHTLKGASGMIGAHRLHARAGDLEEALRLDSGNIRELLASLISEIERVLQLLKVLIEGSPPAGMPVQLPPGQLLSDTVLLERFTELLTNRDGAAIDMLQASRASLSVIVGVATLGRIEEALREFNYDRALNALGETACGQGI